MLKKSSQAMLLVGILVGIGQVGCGRLKPAGEPVAGTVSLALTATGVSGAVYRLRSATFSITGPENKTLPSPIDPTDPLAQLTQSLLPGAYQIALADGWKMWRIPTTGDPAQVPANLISAKMVALSVASSQDTKVNFQFDVLGESPVPGTVTIGIGVTETDGGSDAAVTPDGASDASVTPDVPAGAVCGNGVVEVGEQCDSAAAFASNTCNSTTCQNIPAVCGNFMIQPGEQCDDGPTGSLTCTATCMTVGAASTCLDCETAGTNAKPPVCMGTKQTTQSTVVGCAGLSTTDKQTQCTTLLHCLQTHPNCSISAAVAVANSDPTACFCGTLSAGACAGAPSANIAGACAAAYFAVYGGVSDANRDNILGDFFNRTLPVGMANNLYACDVLNSCQSKCP
jgi:hypothetical protein